MQTEEIAQAGSNLLEESLEPAIGSLDYSLSTVCSRSNKCVLGGGRTFQQSEGVRHKGTPQKPMNDGNSHLIPL